jgi:quercetin dioxygenase-like cupin family protein
MFFKDSEIKLDRVDDNTLRKTLAYGDGLMNTLCIFERGLDVNATIPFHQHEQVQTTYVLKGSFKFAIKYADHVDVQTVNVGDSIYFPSNHEHGCIPLEDDSRLIDSFNPIREDFL